METESRTLINTFTEQQLKRLHCTDDEVALVLEYQRLLPVLCKENEIEKFCVDARTLHEQLTNGDTKSKFADWIKKNLQDEIENEDYIVVDNSTNVCFVSKRSKEILVKSSKRGGSNRKDYLLTLDTAKGIAMITGKMNHVSEELKKRSKLARRYFILMEKIVKDNNFWEIVRYIERKRYKPMDEVLGEYIRRNFNREPNDIDYAREADIINIICIGYKARDIKLLKGAVFKGYDTRDCLSKEQNEYIKEAQELNITLLDIDLADSLRYQAIWKDFKRKHPTPDLICDDIDTINKHRKAIGLNI